MSSTSNSKRTYQMGLSRLENLNRKFTKHHYVIIFHWKSKIPTSSLNSMKKKTTTNHQLGPKTIFIYKVTDISYLHTIND